MLICEFIGEPYRDYEGLGLPAIPDTITRTSLRHYRVIMCAHQRKLEKKYMARTQQFVPVYYHRRRSFWYRQGPVESKTKIKRRIDAERSNRGRPVHSNRIGMPDPPVVLTELIQIAKKVIAQIDARWPNLPPERGSPPRRTPPPTAAEFFE